MVPNRWRIPIGAVRGALVAGYRNMYLMGQFGVARTVTVRTGPKSRSGSVAVVEPED